MYEKILLCILLIFIMIRICIWVRQHDRMIVLNEMRKVIDEGLEKH